MGNKIKKAISYTLTTNMALLGVNLILSLYMSTTSYGGLFNFQPNNPNPIHKIVREIKEDLSNYFLNNDEHQERRIDSNHLEDSLNQ